MADKPVRTPPHCPAQHPPLSRAGRRPGPESRERSDRAAAACLQAGQRARKPRERSERHEYSEHHEYSELSFADGAEFTHVARLATRSSQAPGTGRLIPMRPEEGAGGVEAPADAFDGGARPLTGRLSATFSSTSTAPSPRSTTTRSAVQPAPPAWWPRWPSCPRSSGMSPSCPPVRSSSCATGSPRCPPRSTSTACTAWRCIAPARRTPSPARCTGCPRWRSWPSAPGPSCPATTPVEYKRLSRRPALPHRPASWAGGSRRGPTSEAERLGLRTQSGRMVVELKPPVDQDKGTVIAEAVRGAGCAWYFGDDMSDIKAFEALRAREAVDPASSACAWRWPTRRPARDVRGGRPDAGLPSRPGRLPHRRPGSLRRR